MERASVIGLGTMGSGIAQLLLQNGFSVVGIEEEKARADAGEQKVLAGIAKAVEKGKMTADAAEAARKKFRTATDVKAGSEGADLVVEAIVENMHAKRKVFAALENVVVQGALLASNTSSLSITELAAGLKAPESFVGLHFFNPVAVMQLLEIVRGERTSEATVDRARELAKRLGKEPIAVRDFPGFASSRLGIILGLEAMRMLEQGVASAEDIDRAMELGYRHPMGPLKLTDLVGLDVRLAIAEHLHREIGEQFRPPQILRRLVKAGKLGKKSGAGFYEYPDEKK